MPHKIALRTFLARGGLLLLWIPVAWPFEAEGTLQVTWFLAVLVGVVLSSILTHRWTRHPWRPGAATAALLLGMALLAGHGYLLKRCRVHGSGPCIELNTFMPAWPGPELQAYLDEHGSVEAAIQADCITEVDRYSRADPNLEVSLAAYGGLGLVGMFLLNLGLLHLAQGLPLVQASIRPPNGARNLVFVSYRTADRPAARALVTALEAAGQPCWFDERDMPLGAVVAVSIDVAFEAADRALFLWGPTGWGPYQRLEISAWLSYVSAGRATAAVIVLPGAGPVPGLLAGLKHTPLPNPPEEEALGRTVDLVRDMKRPEA